jgi:hypothetical protein
MYLYGLVHRSAIENLIAIDRRGIAGDLRRIESGELLAIVESGFPVQACAESEQALIAAIVVHDRVLLSAFAVTTVLPLRFGTEFTSETALLSHLEQKQSLYLAAIHALEHKAEVSLKLCFDLPEPELIPATLKGRDYFHAKKQQAQQQQSIQSRLDADRQTLVEALQSQNIQVFTKSVDHYLLLCDRDCDLTVILENCKLVNPWTWKMSEFLPPYHFAGDLLA